MRTTRDATHPGGRALRLGVAGVLALGGLAGASLALGAASFSDAAGDDNAAPDITAVSVVESTPGSVTITVTVGNYTTLPARTWLNLWFDLDSNQDTGDAGDEALVRFVAGGEMQLYHWDGAEMVERPATGISGQFSGGVLTTTVPTAELGEDSVFGLLVVSSRSQQAGPSEFIASDYAPDRDRSVYLGPALAAFPDPGNDGDAAPDITAVAATDSRDGWISFAVTTPNYATLPGDSVLAVAIDRDNRASTGDGGAELLIRTLSGEAIFERWSPEARAWEDDAPPRRVRVRNSGNVVTIDVHRSELDETPRFGFSVTTADVNTQAGSILAIDFAPDSGGFYRYTLANRPALRLIATRLSATPAQPRAGRRFMVNLAVRRSDTNRGITSGRVSCNVRLGSTKLAAKGSVLGGRARCAFVLPGTASGGRLRGTITVRVGGKSVSSRFAYIVR
ncbi:MAG: hypothetical protein ACRDNY_08945 [Gaiellaceae bacterium]